MTQRVKPNDYGNAMKKLLLAAFLVLCAVIILVHEKFVYKAKSSDYREAILTSQIIVPGPGQVLPAAISSGTARASDSRQIINNTGALTTVNVADSAVRPVAELVASDHQMVHQPEKMSGSEFKAEEWRPQVRETAGPEGHQSIQLVYGHSSDEASFEILQTWDYSTERNIIVPFEVKRLHEQTIAIAGFMFPLEEGEKIGAFCLMATTQVCCYGPKPQFNQFILVESSEKVTFERIRPVKVVGKFFIDPQPQDGYIFRMQAEKVIQAAAPKIIVYADPGNASLMPWSVLEKLRPASVQDIASCRIPRELIALDQKKVTVGGHYLGQFDVAENVAFMIGIHYWDRCCQGTPPDIFNAVMVFPASSGVDLFSYRGMASFSGTLEVNTEPDTWKAKGIVTLQNAQLISTTE